MDKIGRRLVVTRATWIKVLFGVGGALGLALSLAYVSSGYVDLQDWPSFLGAILIGAVLLGLGWYLLHDERPPGWLFALLLGAALLRLAVGVFWFTALPLWGHGTPGELAGYVMADAYERDRVAWQAAISPEPLWSAFDASRGADQYGGLLFLSALLYRTLGSRGHQPLLIIVVTAAFSALSVLFAWALARRAWPGGLNSETSPVSQTGEASAPGANDRIAAITAACLALYPDAVLMGSSQMREAFSMTLVLMAFYGLVRFSQERKMTSLLWPVAALLLNLPFSPPFTGLLLAMLALAALSLQKNLVKGNLLNQRWFLAGLVGLAILILVGMWVALRQFAPAEINDPLGVLSWWLRKSGEWQAVQSKRASGWVQKIFKNTPEWTHLPLLALYGVSQPFLPAALSATSSSPLWTAIVIWRALGWTLLLAFLLYASFLALRRGRGLDFSRALVLIAWLGILVSSFRGGGDLWDNPRYRTTFAGLFIMLAAWAWVEQRRLADAWLRRVLVGAGFFMGWLMLWYLRRYAHLAWPIEDLFKTVGLGFASAALYFLWDWARMSPAAHVTGGQEHRGGQEHCLDDVNL